MRRLTHLVKEAARWTGFEIARTRRRHAGDAAAGRDRRGCFDPGERPAVLDDQR